MEAFALPMFPGQKMASGTACYRRHASDRGRRTCQHKQLATDPPFLFYSFPSIFGGAVDVYVVE